ncbi:MAG: hypothetical protein AB9M60_19535 [Leptothrix sp. (in: b-proteobacteria)]
MKTKNLIVSLAVLWFAQGTVNAQVKASVECMSSGTKVNGVKGGKLFSEKIQVESRKEAFAGKGGRLEEWGISKAELVSDGEKQKASLVVATPDYAVLSNAVTVGTGFERRLLVFTYMIDLKAMQLTRVVNSLPAAAEERTSVICTAK